MALIAWFDPRVLNAQDSDEQRLEYDSGEVVTVTTGQVREVLHEYADTFMYLQDWENGLFSVSQTEYQRLPCTLVDIRRLYHTMRQKNGNRKT